MVLSILIPTVETRRSLLSRMLWSIEQQLTPEVEVLVYDGWIPFGDKVTELFQLAKGKYAFVADDDDMLVEGHIAAVLAAAKSDPDYIAYKVLHMQDGKYAGSVASTMHGDKVWNKSPYYIHHKCPIRTTIGKQVPFGNHYRTDRDWSVAVGEQVKSETIIGKHLYVYDYWSSGTVGTVPSDQNKDSQRDVGQWPYDPALFTWVNR